MNSLQHLLYYQVLQKSLLARLLTESFEILIEDAEKSFIQETNNANFI